MKKIAMNKFNEDAILGWLTEGDVEVNIPPLVVVKSYESGTVENGSRTIDWARLEVVDMAELEALESVGLAENANILKVKLQNYQGQLLENFVGKTISTEEMELVLEKRRQGNNSNIDGVAFRTDISTIKEVR